MFIDVIVIHFKRYGSTKLNLNESRARYLLNGIKFERGNFHYVVNTTDAVIVDG